MVIQDDGAGKETGRGYTMLTFRLEKQTFALPLPQVRQILEMITIIPLLQVKDYVEGVINFHGSVIPVVNLRSYMQLPRQPLGSHTPIILVNLEGWMLGLIVDEVLDVANLSNDQIFLPQNVLPKAFGNLSMLKGVIREQKNMVMLLDLVQLFKTDETQSLMEQIQEVSQSVDAGTRE